MGGMLGWDKQYREVYRSFLNHPNLIPYLHLTLGIGFRLSHSPLIIGQKQGSEGFAMHGGSITPGSEELSQDLLYVCKNNEIWNTLVAATIFLKD